jgi:hypothetical protein
MSGFHNGAKYLHDADIKQFPGFGSSKAAYGNYYKDLKTLYEKYCQDKKLAVYTADSWIEFIKAKEWDINWWAYPSYLKHWFQDEFHQDAPAPWSEKLARLVTEDSDMEAIVRERLEIVKDQQKRYEARDVRFRTSKSPNNTSYPQVFQPKKKLSSGGAGGAAGAAAGGAGGAAGAPAGGAGGAAGAPAAGAPAGGAPAAGAPKPRPAKPAAKVGGSDKGKAVAKPNRPPPGKSPARPVQPSPAGQRERMQVLDTSSDEDAPDGDEGTHVLQDARAIQEMADIMEKGVEIYVKSNSFGNVLFAVPNEELDDISALLAAGMVPYSSFAEYMCKNEGVDASDSRHALVTGYFQNTSGIRFLRRVDGVRCKLRQTAEIEIDDDSVLWDHVAYEEMMSMRINFSVDSLYEAKKDDDAHLLLKVWGEFLNPDEQDKFLQKRKKDEENAAKMHKFRTQFYNLHHVSDMQASHAVAQELIANGTLSAADHQRWLARRRTTMMENGGFIAKTNQLIQGQKMERTLQFYVEHEDKFTEQEKGEYMKKQEELIELMSGLANVQKTMEFEDKHGDIPEYFEKLGMKNFLTNVYKDKYAIYLSARNQIRTDKNQIRELMQKLKEVQASDGKRRRSPSPAGGAADRSSPPRGRSARSVSFGGGRPNATPSPPRLPPNAADEFSPAPSRGGSRRASRQVSPENMRDDKRARTPTRLLKPSSDAGYGTSTKPRK